VPALSSLRVRTTSRPAKTPYHPSSVPALGTVSMCEPNARTGRSSFLEFPRLPMILPTWSTLTCIRASFMRVMRNLLASKSSGVRTSLVLPDPSLAPISPSLARSSRRRSPERCIHRIFSNWIFLPPLFLPYFRLGSAVLNLQHFYYGFYVLLSPS